MSVAAGRPLERERELAELRDALADASAGSGQLIVVEGPAGIGKSRLLDEAGAIARVEGMDVLRARGGELEQEYAFGVVLDLLEPRFARSTPTERERLLQGRAALAGPSLAKVDARVGRGAPTDEFALVHGLYWCVVNLSEQRPVAIVVDDVHWADELSLRFLVYLARRLDDLSGTLIVGLRTGDPGPESDLLIRLASTEGARTLRPGELSLSATGELLADLGLEVAGREELVRACWEGTRGNPFLLRELAVEMRGTPGAWESGDPSELARFAPDSVRRSVVLRLRRLGPDALALAQACAVLGAEAPLHWAARLANLDAVAAAAAAERLRAAQILAPTDAAAFQHPVIRSAIYEDLPPGERPRAHADIARILKEEGAPAEQIAHHLLASAPTPAPWACAALHEGARAAARRGGLVTAMRYLRRAVDVCPPGDRTAQVLIDLGVVEAACGETSSLSRFEQALTVIDAPADHADALYALGLTLFRYGRHLEAAETFRRGADLFADSERTTGLRFEGAFMCVAMYVAPLLAEAGRRLESIAAPIIEHGPANAEERVLLAVLAERRAGTRPPARANAALAELAIGAGALLREQTSDSLAVNLTIYALLWSGRTSVAQQLADDVLADARDRDSVLAFAEASLARALVMLTRGRITEAMADAQSAIVGMKRGWRTGVPAPQGILVECLIERGDIDAAATVVEDLEQLLAGPETCGLNGFFYRARGRVRLARSDPGGALSDFLENGRVIEPYGDNPAIFQWRTYAALAAHAIGDRDHAMRLVGEELELARSYGLPAQIGAALRVRAIVGDEASAIRTLEQAAEVLQESDAPLELAYTLAELGARQRRVGHRVLSRNPLRRALALAEQCGATMLEQRAREELLVSGAKPRRAAMTGVAALTPSELRIARLAATGRTNRAIAETLFLTKNTVEWHLRHVYRKLDVSSRAALASCFESEQARPGRH